MKTYYPGERFIAACETGKADLVQEILKINADVVWSENGMLGIVGACKHGHASIVQMIADKVLPMGSSSKGELDHVVASISVGLVEASRYNHIKVVNTICTLPLPMLVEDLKMEAMLEAAKQENLDILKILCPNTYIVRSDIHPLTGAVLVGSKKVAQLLIQKLEDKTHFLVPLEQAIQYYDLSMMQLLLEETKIKSLEISIFSSSSQLIMTSFDMGFVEAAKLLVSWGLPIHGDALSTMSSRIVKEASTEQLQIKKGIDDVMRIRSSIDKGLINFKEALDNIEKDNEFMVRALEGAIRAGKLDNLLTTLKTKINEVVTRHAGGFEGFPRLAKFMADLKKVEDFQEKLDAIALHAHSPKLFAGLVPGDKEEWNIAVAARDSFAKPSADAAAKLAPQACTLIYPLETEEGKAAMAKLTPEHKARVIAHEVHNTPIQEEIEVFIKKAFMITPDREFLLQCEKECAYANWLEEWVYHESEPSPCEQAAAAAYSIASEAVLGEIEMPHVEGAAIDS
jgi:hypothetical protein